MPKDEQEEATKTESVQENAAKSESVAAEKQYKSRMTLLIVLVAFSLLIGGAIIATISASMRSNAYYSSPSEVTVYSRRFTPRVHRVFFQSAQVTSSNDILVSGVVTSVTGTSFVIAGNGSQTTIDTTGDTTYNTTDKKVSVNDSVVVIGTKSNSTVTAADVRITNL